MDEQQTPTAGTPIYQGSQQKNAKWLWLLILLIIIGALVFAYVKQIGPFATLRLPFGQQASPSPESELFTSPTPEASPASSLDKSEAKVKVLNGSGKAGAASTVKDLLETKGWTVSSLGNADNYNFTKTVVKFKETFKSFEELIVSDLSDDYSVTVSTEELEATDSADIEVTVGTD